VAAKWPPAGRGALRALAAAAARGEACRWPAPPAPGAGAAAALAATRLAGRREPPERTARADRRAEPRQSAQTAVRAVPAQCRQSADARRSPREQSVRYGELLTYCPSY